MEYLPTWISLTELLFYEHTPSQLNFKAKQLNKVDSANGFQHPKPKTVKLNILHISRGLGEYKPHK